MIEQITEEILTMFSELDKPIIPLEIVVKKLGDTYQLTEIEEAIEQALDSYQIDKVLDYSAPEWNLYGGYPIWHLQKLSSEGSDALHGLKEVELALLHLLKHQNEPKHFGEIKTEDARTILQNQGFTQKETEFLWVEDMVDHHYDFEDGKSIEWCRLIPENEKTEEYKKAQERMDEEYAEKEAIRMFIADTHDIASEILRAVHAFPDGISKKDIIKQLFMDDPQYVNEAFAIATSEDEILPITLENNEEGYHFNPDFEEDE